MEVYAMKHILKIVVCLQILLAAGLQAETVQQSQPVAAKGETVIVAKSAKLSVRVKIITHQVNIGKPSDERPEVVHSSCTYSRYPCSIIDGIDITVNGKPLFMPRSVFCDLADLNRAKVRIELNKSILTLTGGDASESYIATIEFDKDRIKHRSLAPGEAPNEPLQETTYHEVIIGD
jgi:hypothetical protein